MFIAHDHTFKRDLVLTQPVKTHYFTPENVRFYDKDGFELTPLEIEHYKENSVPLTSYLYNLACHKPWIEQVNDTSGIILDHSMILERYSFGGDAKWQLEYLSDLIPQLHKLIQTKHKWGIDFSVDYIKDGEVTDVFHLEVDSYNYDHIVELHGKATERILSIDWESGAKAIRNRKDEWQHLEGHAQSDWKAQFFGFPASEEICKVF